MARPLGELASEARLRGLFVLIIIYSPREVNAEYFLSALVFCRKWGTIKETTTNKGAQLWQDRT